MLEELVEHLCHLLRLLEVRVVLAAAYLAVDEGGGRLCQNGSGGLGGGLLRVGLHAEHRTLDLGRQSRLGAVEQLTELRLLDPSVGGVGVTVGADLARRPLQQQTGGLLGQTTLAVGGHQLLERDGRLRDRTLVHGQHVVQQLSHSVGERGGRRLLSRVQQHQALDALRVEAGVQQAQLAADAVAHDGHALVAQLAQQEAQREDVGRRESLRRRRQRHRAAVSGQVERHQRRRQQRRQHVERGGVVAPVVQSDQGHASGLAPHFGRHLAPRHIHAQFAVRLRVRLQLQRLTSLDVRVEPTRGHALSTKIIGYLVQV